MIWKKYIINYYIYGDLIMKMEIELTDEQAKKVEILKENGMDIGDAVDALFEMKDMIKSQSTTAANRPAW